MGGQRSLSRYGGGGRTAKWDSAWLICRENHGAFNCQGTCFHRWNHQSGRQWAISIHSSGYIFRDATRPTLNIGKRTVFRRIFLQRKQRTLKSRLATHASSSNSLVLPGPRPAVSRSARSLEWPGLLEMDSEYYRFILLQYSVFSIRYSVFGIQYSVFSIRYSVFSIRYSVFSLLQLRECVIITMISSIHLFRLWSHAIILPGSQIGICSKIAHIGLYTIGHPHGCAKVLLRGSISIFPFYV